MAVCVAAISYDNREKGSSTLEPFKFGRPPMRGFLIHFLVYIIVVGALAALDMIINPNHPWVLWILIGWGIGARYWSIDQELPGWRIRTR